MKRKIIKSLVLAFSLFILYLGLLIFPSILFAHSITYKSFEVYSDQEIPESITQVLDDAYMRLQVSELLDQNDKFKIYICNANWKFQLLTRNKNAGGVVNFPISANVFIRESDIKNNQIIPPYGWLLSREDRPLSYFIAHEATHALQRKTNPLLQVITPSYIIEGYADYVAKSPTFDFAVYLKQYETNNLKMDPANGLYNMFHLYIAYLMDKEGMSFKDIIDQKPDIDSTFTKIDKLLEK